LLLFHRILKNGGKNDEKSGEIDFIVLSGIAITSGL